MIVFWVCLWPVRDAWRPQKVAACRESGDRARSGCPEASSGNPNIHLCLEMIEWNRKIHKCTDFAELFTAATNCVMRRLER